MIGEMTDSFERFIFGSVVGLSMPSLIALGTTFFIKVGYYPKEIKAKTDKKTYKDYYLNYTRGFQIKSTLIGKVLGTVGFVFFNSTFHSLPGLMNKFSFIILREY